MIRDISSLGRRQFDLLVCGGGIYGAWTAYDAAQRGLSVAIVDKGDWASGTSSASSKLIHGGLRYLETYDFGLVRKALAERQILLKYGPHRIWPLRFGVPVYSDSRIGKLKLAAGLMLYDLLAGLPSEKMRSMGHDKFGFSEHFACLKEAGLRGGFSYGDGQTDDARLVLELISGAQALGATCVNYCALTEFADQVGRDQIISARDNLTGNNVNISAKQVVYTTGRWATTTDRGADWCRLSKGIHLVMPSISTDAALLLTARSDGRVFFLIPWYGMTLLGTTDDDYLGDLEHVEIEHAEVTYLLEEANHYLKTLWTESDVVGRYAGVRAMKYSSVSSPSSASRDWELKSTDSKTHYSIGGKITSAREDAANIVDTVCDGLDIKRACQTNCCRFPWAPEGDYTQWSAEKTILARELDIDEESIKWLLRRHGKRVEVILAAVEHDRSLAKRINISLPVINADMLFCAEHEMVVHLHDLLRRRLPLTIMSRVDKCKLREIAALVAPLLSWDDTDIDREVDSCFRQ
ncbi:MAG: glycerol-3-phosphate dehydrogenase/oxidase [Gallionella sp.]